MKNWCINVSIARCEIQHDTYSGKPRDKPYMGLNHKKNTHLISLLWVVYGMSIVSTREKKYEEYTALCQHDWSDAFLVCV